MQKSLTATMLASAMILGLAGSVGATTIGFDNVMGGNPHGSYVEDGYSFTPNSGTEGNCPVTTDAPCVKELSQGVVTTMTTVAPNGLFDLLGFDFLLVGSGNNNENTNNTSSMVVKGYLDPAKTFEIKMGDALGTFTNYILTTVTGVATGNVTWNEGYRVTFLNGFFDDLVKAEFLTTAAVYDDCRKPNGDLKNNCTPGWSDSGNAQARIDNIVVPDPVQPPPVPVPAAGWMLIAGLGSLVAARRARKAA